MAANAIVMRAFITNVIGVTDNAVRDAIMDQGLDAMSTLADMDTTELETILKTCRRPGGVNRGFAVTGMTEIRLKQAIQAASFYDMVGRPVDAATLTRSRIKSMKAFYTIEDEHTDPKEMPAVSKTLPVLKWLEILDTTLQDMRGVQKSPLSYLIRDEVNVPAHADDPLRATKAYGTAYETFQEELEARSTHGNEAYKEDNSRLYQIIQRAVAGTIHESSIKAFERRRDGRGSYLALKQQNGGASKWRSIIAKAERESMQDIWDGRNARYTVYNHVSKHRAAYNNLLRASDNVPYQVPDAETRVRRLLDSIKTTVPEIVSAITHIKSCPLKQGDFEATAEFLLECAPIAKVPTGGREHSVAAVHDEGDIDDHADFQYTEAKKGNTGVEFRYYPYREFNQLSNNQQKELTDWRRKNGNSRGKKDDENPTKKTKFLESKISALESHMEKMSKYMEQQDEHKVSAVTLAEAAKAPSGNRGILKPPTYNLGQKAADS